MKIETVPIDSVIPYVRNPRTGGAVAKVAGSLKEFGWKQPIVVDGEMVVIAGHTRLEAARSLGYAKVPVLIARDLDPVKVKAYRIADNRVADDAEWDAELLALELTDLKDLAYDLPILGFEDGELQAYFAGAGTGAREDEDDVPEPPAEPTTRPGDLWLLDKHRLLCGNATLQSAVEHLMGNARADMVFTDPPYGVAYLGSAKSDSIAGDITQTAIPISFKQAIDHATTKDARLYFCGGSSNVTMYYSLFDSYLRKLPTMIIWDKGSIVMRRNNYHSQYEIIFYGWKGVGGANEFWFGPRTSDAASDIWGIKRDPAVEYLHPTQKPVALARRSIENSAPLNGIVYEPFSGSGSTLIAAETVEGYVVQWI